MEYILQYSETCTNGHLCKMDNSLPRTFYLSPFIFHYILCLKYTCFIFHYILCLKYTCYYGHLSNAYNRQMICAQEALIRLRPGKKNFGSGQLIFENWSGGLVDVFFFLNHNLNFPNLMNVNM